MKIQVVPTDVKGGGGGVLSVFGCRDTILKKAQYGKNYRSQGGKSIHFWKALTTSFTETSKSFL